MRNREAGRGNTREAGRGKGEAFKLLIGLLLLASTACSKGKGYTVEVLDGQFSPSTITVPIGGTVSWSWNGFNDHSVKFPDVESPTQQLGSFGKTFNTPGSYRYECGVHPAMVGTVVVR